MALSGDLYPEHVLKGLAKMNKEEEFLHNQIIIVLKEIAVDVLGATTSLQRKSRKVAVVSVRNKENESIRSFCGKYRRPFFLLLIFAGGPLDWPKRPSNILCNNLNS